MVLLVLPSAQIKLGASQLHGLVGSYLTGSYWDITYSSQGTTTWDTLNADRTLTPHSRAWPSTGTGDSLDTDGMDATCVGTVTPTLTWVHAPGLDDTSDPPPTQVIITENGYAHYLGGGPGHSPGTLSDGWSADTPPNSPNDIYGPNYYYTASGTHTEVKDGTSGTITLSAFSLNASTPAASDLAVGSNEVAVSVYLNLSPAIPVTISPDGAVKDADGKYNILGGQGFSPRLEGVATSGTTYAWTVSGITFQDWQPATSADPNATPPRLANKEASYYSDGSGVLTNVAAHWYWNDPGPTPTDEMVTCAATVTPNDGKNAPYTVTVTQKVTVYVPSWTASGIGGYVQVNTDCPDDQGYVALWAGPYVSPTGKYDTHHGGMDWTATCKTPQNPVAFGTGTLELVQLATPNRSYTTNTAPPVLHPSPETTNGLDSFYPYRSIGPSPYVEGGSAYLAYDDPYIGLNYYNPKSAAMADSFDDYLLYQPPGTDVRWVPLANFKWNTDTTNGSVTIPNSGCINYKVTGTPSDKAGKVYVAGKLCTEPPTSSPFTSWHIHPSWTLINTFSTKY